MFDLAVDPYGRPWMTVRNGMQISVMCMGGKETTLGTCVRHMGDRISGVRFTFLGFWQDSDGPQGVVPVLLGKGFLQDQIVYGPYTWKGRSPLIPEDCIKVGERPIFKADNGGDIVFASLLSTNEVVWATPTQAGDRSLRIDAYHLGTNAIRAFHPFTPFGSGESACNSAFCPGLNGDVWLLEAHSIRAEEPRWLWRLFDASQPLPSGERDRKMLETGIRDIGCNPDGSYWAVGSSNSGTWDPTSLRFVSNENLRHPGLGAYRSGFRVLNDGRRSYVGRTMRHGLPCVYVEHLELPLFAVVTPTWSSPTGGERYWGLSVRHSESERRSTYHLCEMDVP